MKQVLLLILLITVNADMYLQSIRGSNNRLDEANRERNNANRMFDSQNNNRGGYNVGKLNMYEGEEIPVSWTLQHGCGTDDTKHCEVVVQVMCDDIIRDGTTTQRIPDNPANCRNFNCDLDPQFGRHESYAFYETCKSTERNKGLFTSSQNLNQNSATRTRQNPGGTRSGYECPEERDYYPYWRPSPWMDLAIFTKDTARCAEYQRLSENVVGRWYCDVPERILDILNNNNNKFIPIQQDPCLALNEEYPAEANSTDTEAAWRQAPAHNMPAPECLVSEASRPNHLGLIGHDKQWTNNMKVPWGLIPEGRDTQACAMRFRYNITQDYDAYLNADDLNPGNVTADYNSVGNPKNANTNPATMPIWEWYGLNYDEVAGSYPNEDQTANDGETREYVMKNNPQVDPLGLGATLNNPVRLQLAINTAQFGRTFQDRTHVFTVQRRPSNIPAEARIKMLTVAGKRGNIVQTFPGTEYFMVPERISLKADTDYLHIGWTGSNTNPNNNDGQGKQGTDRHNMVPLRTANFEGGETDDQIGAMGNSYPAYVRSPDGYSIPEIQQCNHVDDDGEPIMFSSHVAPKIGGFPEEALIAMATGRQVDRINLDYGNMEELDDAGTSFELPPMRGSSDSEGCYSYVSTRNNNFSNRSQKATLCVTSGEYEVVDIGSSGGAVMTETGWIYVPEGSLEGIQAFTFRSEDGEGVSQTVYLEPVELNLGEGQSIEFAVEYEKRALRKAELFHRKTDEDSWSSIDATFKSQDGATVAVADVSSGGQYRVEDKIDGAAVAAIVIGALFVVGAGLLVLYFKIFSSPSTEKKQSFKSDIQY